MKLLELQSTKEFASTFLNDIFFKMAVNRVLDAAPKVDAIPVDAEDIESAELCLKVLEKFLSANPDYYIEVSFCFGKKTMTLKKHEERETE